MSASVRLSPDESLDMSGAFQVTVKPGADGSLYVFRPTAMLRTWGRRQLMSSLWPVTRPSLCPRTNEPPWPCTPEPPSEEVGPTVKVKVSASRTPASSVAV